MGSAYIPPNTRTGSRLRIWMYIFSKVLFLFWVLDQEIIFPLCFASKSHVILTFSQCENILYTVSSLGKWLLKELRGKLAFQALWKLSDNFCIQIYAQKTRAEVYAITLKAKLLVRDNFLRTSKRVSSLLLDWLMDHKSSQICLLHWNNDHLYHLLVDLSGRNVFFEHFLYETNFVTIHTVMVATHWKTAAFFLFSSSLHKYEMLSFKHFSGINLMMRTLYR